MRQRVAVVGAGVAGIVSSYLLQQRYEVTLFEQSSRLGGHTNTVVISEGEDKELAVDTGFIVLNNKNYPLFHRFLERLQVPVRWSDMSFGFYGERSKFLYAGTTLNGLFADRANLLRPSFYRFLAELKRFCSDAMQAVNESFDGRETVGQFARRRSYSQEFISNYLLPMTSAIWSCPASQSEEFPALSLFEFYRNHGLLSLKDRPRWQTVVGGSHSYLKAFHRTFSGDIRLSTPLVGVAREDSGATISLADGSSERFDIVVLAAHADQSLKLLKEPSELEKRLLTPWNYQRNLGYLHYDSAILPPVKRAWASWNVRTVDDKNSKERSIITYHMNRLQGFRSERDYCVSFDCEGSIDQKKVVARLDYYHPVYDLKSVATQSELPKLNEEGPLYFCGSYFGYGFHEDAVRSAVNVAASLGISGF